MKTEQKEPRHIVSLSGGKDSTALAVFLKQNYSDLPFEYVFMDTGEELKETYEYLEKVETYLGTKIIRLHPAKTWDQYLEGFSGYLPSPQNRWCTVQMKIKPYERFVGDDPVISYIGIRSDETREGYISTKPGIKAKYPFIEHGITRDDVFRILDEAGLGLPRYYDWRSRSGCYFCFFQRRYEWLGLKEKHPDLFAKAAKFETLNADGSSQGFTWNQGITLEEFVADSDGIRTRHKENQRRLKEKKRKESKSLFDVFAAEIDLEDTLDMDEMEEGCTVCQV